MEENKGCVEALMEIAFGDSSEIGVEDSIPSTEDMAPIGSERNRIFSCFFTASVFAISAILQFTGISHAPFLETLWAVFMAEVVVFMGVRMLLSGWGGCFWSSIMIISGYFTLRYVWQILSGN